ncbi:MAG: gephyrin-like molybdotransferase Glp [Pseudomonadota bacterium]
MAIEKQPSCEDESEPELLPVEVALERISTQITPLCDNQHVPLRQSLGRVVAQPVQSPINVPAYTNSAMDGYAVSSADLPSSGEKSLQVIGTAWAGRPLDTGVKQGQAVRIMTGGKMPEGTDTVVIQEHADATVSGDKIVSVRIDGSTEAGRNVRQAGEDIKTGDTIIAVGELITPAHVGLIASLGIDSVVVFRKLKVAFFSTGDELRALETYAGQALGPGEIFDSNRHTLFAMLQRLGVELIDLGVVPDTADDTRQALLDAAQSADVIISSGGVSAGQADFVSKTLADIGVVTFWKLAMRPGRPLACGKVNNAHFFGLPGNPVAVMVTFYEFVQPAIKRMMGCTVTSTPLFKVVSAGRIRKIPGRVEYQRGIMSHEDGQMVVRTTGKQGAGRLTSMCLANCLIVLPVECDGVDVGDMVDVQPFDGLM